MRQTPQTPQAPQAPQPAQAPRPAATPRVAQEVAPRPVTADEIVRQISEDAALQALRIRRAETVEQIRTLTNRRNELQAQREKMGLEDGRGHEERIRLIDQRSAQLERELLQIDEQMSRGVSNVAGQQIASERVDAASGTIASSDMLRDIRRAANSGAEDGAISALAGTGTFLVFALLLYKGVRRWIWKPKPVAAVGSGITDAQQIAQLQRSLDVVAVEVERIAEAQRYVAKLLNDRALGAGEAQPVHSRGAVNVDPVERR